jgi:hypothetical protein
MPQSKPFFSSTRDGDFPLGAFTIYPAITAPDITILVRMDEAVIAMPGVAVPVAALRLGPPWLSVVIPVDNTKTIASITLPNDKNVEVLPITAVP